MGCESPTQVGSCAEDDPANSEPCAPTPPFSSIVRTRADVHAHVIAHPPTHACTHAHLPSTRMHARAPAIELVEASLFLDHSDEMQLGYFVEGRRPSLFFVATLSRLWDAAYASRTRMRARTSTARTYALEATHNECTRKHTQAHTCPCSAASAWHESSSVSPSSTSARPSASLPAVLSENFLSHPSLSKLSAFMSACSSPTVPHAFWGRVSGRVDRRRAWLHSAHRLHSHWRHAAAEAPARPLGNAQSRQRHLDALLAEPHAVAHCLPLLLDSRHGLCAACCQC